MGGWEYNQEVKGYDWGENFHIETQMFRLLDARHTINFGNLLEWQDLKYGAKILFRTFYR